MHHKWNGTHESCCMSLTLYSIFRLVTSYWKNQVALLCCGRHFAGSSNEYKFILTDSFILLSISILTEVVSRMTLPPFTRHEDSLYENYSNEMLGTILFTATSSKTFLEILPGIQAWYKIKHHDQTLMEEISLGKLVLILHSVLLVERLVEAIPRYMNGVKVVQHLTKTVYALFI